MSENLQNNYSTTLASGYTAGVGTISVTVAPATGNGTYTMTLVIRDQSTLAVKLLFRVTSVSGTTLTGAAEGTDANAASGDFVSGSDLTVASLNQIRKDWFTSSSPGSVNFTIDGGGSVPSTGSKGFIQFPFAGTIKSWTLLGDQSGSAQITIKKSTYSGFPTTSSIIASAPPLLSSAQKNTDSTLSGWTTSVTVGDVWEFNLDSVTTCTRLNLSVVITRS